MQWCHIRSERLWKTDRYIQCKKKYHAWSVRPVSHYWVVNCNLITKFKINLQKKVMSCEHAVSIRNVNVVEYFLKSAKLHSDTVRSRRSTDDPLLLLFDRVRIRIEFCFCFHFYLLSTRFCSIVIVATFITFWRFTKKMCVSMTKIHWRLIRFKSQVKDSLFLFPFLF